MVEILGIVGSARPWGNSELVVRQTLRGAQRMGAGIRLLRLTDLRLEPCTGCLRCVIGGQPCRIEDDMAYLISSIENADGLVLAAPTYFLGPAAVVKLVLDRLMMVAGQVDRPLPRPRPAVTIATAGLHGWRGVTLPYLNALAVAFAFHPIYSRTAIAPGPGEVLMDDLLMDQIFDAGCRLGSGELEPISATPNVCPVCRSDAFVLHDRTATCPICGMEATVEQDRHGLHLQFEPVSGDRDHRWTPEGLRKHMNDWVMATGPRFLAQRQEIKSRRRPYRQMEIEWLCPPCSER